jgi:hypothetical protein
MNNGCGQAADHGWINFPTSFSPKSYELINGISYLSFSFLKKEEKKEI